MHKPAFSNLHSWHYTFVSNKAAIQSVSCNKASTNMEAEVALKKKSILEKRLYPSMTFTETLISIGTWVLGVAYSMFSVYKESRRTIMGLLSYKDTSQASAWQSTTPLPISCKSVYNSCSSSGRRARKPIF